MWLDQILDWNSQPSDSLSSLVIMPGFIHFFKKIYFIYVMCVRESICPLQVPEEARGWCLGTGITGSCEPLDVDAVNKTLVLWENSQVLLPTEPSFQCPFFIIMAERHCSLLSHHLRNFGRSREVLTLGLSTSPTPTSKKPLLDHILLC